MAHSAQSETFFKVVSMGGGGADGDGDGNDDAAAAGGADGTADGTADAADAGPSSRQFIQTALVGHKMWRNLSFWEEAFYRSIRDEVRKAYGRQLASASPSGGGAGDGNGGTDGHRQSPPSPPQPVVPETLRPDSREWQYMYQQIVFGQLGSYAMNMRAFGVQDAAVDRVVRRLGHGNGLPEEYLQVLFSNAAASRR